MQCKVCKCHFKAKKENRYEVIENTGLTGAFIGKTEIIHEAFDCPKCGCHNLVNTRKANVVITKGEADNG